MIEVIELLASRRVVIATAPTFTEAKDKVTAMGAAFMEDDAEYVDCADALLYDGRIVAIQPEGFTLAHAEKKAADLYAAGTAHAAKMQAAATAFYAEFLTK